MKNLSTHELCKELLNDWRKKLTLSEFEKTHHAGGLIALDRQLNRLSDRHLRIAVFGRVGVGKSSLLNALLKEKAFATDVAHGSTRQTKSANWPQKMDNLSNVELIDTPGIDEIAAIARARLASRIALNSDLVLLVIDNDLSVIEIEAIETLLKCGKPLLLALNRCDQWAPHEITTVIKSIRNRLPDKAKHLKIEAISAAPRKPRVQANGLIRSEPSKPKIKSLEKTLVTLLETQGELLLTLNALRQAEHFSQSLKAERLKRRKIEAQTIIGKFAAIKASGVAINPLLVFDLATGVALDTALIIQLSKLYELELKGSSARKLLKQLSIHNSLLGGAQVGIQVLLGTLRHILIITTPFTGGISLASSAPVALAQAALAVHTTKITGKLAAQEFLQGKHHKGYQPSSIVSQLASIDPKIRNCLNHWPTWNARKTTNIQTLLP